MILFIQIFVEQLKDDMRIEEPCLKRLVAIMRAQRHPWMIEGVKQYTLAYDIIIKLMKDTLLR